jgi:hypothetical protein
MRALWRICGQQDSTSANLKFQLTLSLVPIKIWKLSEQLRMPIDPTEKPVAIQKAIYPPVHRRLDGSKKEDGEFGELCINDSDYQEAMKRFNRQVLEYYQTQASGRKSTLVSCAGIGLVEDLALQFQLAGVETNHYHHTATPQSATGLSTHSEKGTFQF